MQYRLAFYKNVRMSEPDGNSPIVLPGPEDRTLIVGRSGSGKTQAGLWHLALQDWDKRPWMVLDFKRARMIRELVEPHATLHAIDDLSMPSRPGLYIVRPFEDISRSDEDENDEYNAFLAAVYAKGNIGLFIDEAYQLRRLSGLKLVFVQGRERGIPIFLLYQRPVGIAREVLTETTFVQMFRLKHSEDRKTIVQVTGDSYEPELQERLATYHSWWYDDIRDRLEELGPVDDEQTIGSMIRYKAEKLAGQKVVALR